MIVALGSISRTRRVPGLVEHAIGFKTLADAIALRNRVISMLETAETISDAQMRAEFLTFVFVGAGYAGVEGLAELQDFMGDVIDLYPRCKVQGMRWMLVEARERVMPEVAPSLAAFAQRELRGRGIEIRTGTTIAEVTDRSVRLSDGETIGARTVVWTAGVRPHPLVARMGLELSERGRIKVNRTGRLGYSWTWAATKRWRAR
jgi:NADH dehydrogenase